MEGGSEAILKRKRRYVQMIKFLKERDSKICIIEEEENDTEEEIESVTEKDKKVEKIH